MVFRLLVSILRIIGSESESALIMRILCIERGDCLFSILSAGTSHVTRTALWIQFFLEWCFYLGGFPGLFVGDGLVIGLSGCFRSPWNPLGISVENLFYEIVGLDSRSGLITGDSLANARGLTAVVLAFQSWVGGAVWRPGRDSNPQRARELLECRTGDSRAYSRPAPASR